jgi:hypothetical protein
MLYDILIYAFAVSSFLVFILFARTESRPTALKVSVRSGERQKNLVHKRVPHPRGSAARPLDR